MPPKSQAKTATKLRFIGTPDHYVAGVPQGEVAIVETPIDETQVTLARARELVATHLYAPVDGDLPPAEPAPSEATTNEGATAPEEV